MRRGGPIWWTYKVRKRELGCRGDTQNKRSKEKGLEMSQYFKSSQEAEDFVLKLHTPGLGVQSCLEVYNESINVLKYKEACVRDVYQAPNYCADMMNAVVLDKQHAKILDVAAGTGLVGQELHKFGFRNIHAHDGAAAMVEFCKGLGIYSDYICSMVGDGHRLPVDDNSYDAVGCSGGTVENHLPPSAQAEFARVIKPGGFFVNVYRQNISKLEYGKRWEAEAQRLISDGTWTLYGKLYFPKYTLYVDGVVDIYRVL